MCDQWTRKQGEANGASTEGASSLGEQSRIP